MVVSSDVKNPALGYAGDVTVQQAFDWVAAGQAVLVDIRTDAERAWVGFVPGAVPLAYKQWPGMQINPVFDAGITTIGSRDKKLLLLCRSGIRSIAAAKRATELGLLAYNILEGFEGDADAQGQRGKTGGWKFHGLPWKQD
jgi:rhodanese-related sulfurtransferase